VVFAAVVVLVVFAGVVVVLVVFAGVVVVLVVVVLVVVVLVLVAGDEDTNYPAGQVNSHLPLAS
jgi:5-bromo-4-chloroindolyl phosphate hydrolysis protein